MADSSLPLTSLEYKEWGNPHDEKDYNAMKQWSPIQNIKQDTAYPSVLALGGLYDNRVQFWEPLKYISALRHAVAKSDQSLCCVKIDTNAGHSVGGNHTKYFRIMGQLYAFFLDQVGAIYYKSEGD
ncbi:MAG: hypothetical protein SGILL_000832 [Bacillariaceae sp.]